MIETAVGYLAAYFGRRALGVIGKKVDDAMDQGLTHLYEWVRARLTGRPTAELSLSMLEKEPEGEDQRALVANQLAEALGGDEATVAELKAMIEQLDKLRPPGITIRGLARAEDVYGEQIGVDVEGPLPETGQIEGTAEAKKVHGSNVGVRVGGGGSPQPERPPNRG
jgi:hypothetical protein